jgi:hypothetical protein
MDTHMPSATVLEQAGLRARLPGEPDLDSLGSPDRSQGPEPAAGATISKPPRRYRFGLFASVAIVGVLVVGGGAFLVSPYNHVAPLPVRVTVRAHQLAAQAGIDLDRPFAPLASLAKVHLPQRHAAVVPRYEPQTPGQDLREIVAMQPGNHSTGRAEQSAQTTTRSPNAAPAPASNAQTAAPPGFVAHEPGSPLASAAPPRGVRDITRAVVAAATASGPPTEMRPADPVSEASPSAGSAAATRPGLATAGRPGLAAPASSRLAKPTQAAVVAAVMPDAAERALHLRAAPMTDEQQVQVLELVTEVAAMVRDLKQENASLRADFAKTQADERDRLKDLERRVALAEARAATRAAAADPSLPAPAAAAAPTAEPVSVVRASAALPADVPAAAKRYRVQAASPGMAMLTEVERGGGDGAQLEVTVGDTIPGWGKVLSVEQRGTSWVVSTQHGVIE